ncbi:MAG: membrane-anchored protein YejM (alkaline phosphatase superfamily) [Planctomycetota bacterium]|jgi:membrane-anchored protein YejM (alkaline phosphatase superfamily)
MPRLSKPALPAPSRSALAQGLFRLWLLNVIAGTLVGSLWFFDAPADRAPWIRLYVSLALVSSVAVLTLIPGVVYLGILRWVKNWRAACFLAGMAGAWFLAVLYTDTIVYRLLRYHFFDSAVLNVAFTKGSGDSIILGGYIWTTAAVFISAITLAQTAIAMYFVRRIQGLEARDEKPHVLLRPRTVVLVGFLPSLLFSQTVSAAADVAQNREALRAIQPIPVVPRVRLGQVLEPFLEPSEPRPPELDLLPENAKVNWPHERPKLSPSAPRRNVFICVLDSWRRDMYTPELTPNIHEFSKSARVFDDHLSGGNGTRYGLFTMMYGLHGSYWFPMLAERRAPVMIEALQAEGYDVRVFSSASMNFPEFRDTAWSTVPEANIVDEFPPNMVAWEKDELLSEAFEGWLETREARHDDRPFFTFVLLDAPHQPYTNPGGPYQPTVKELDYIQLGRTTEGPELRDLQLRVRNTYMNSVHHADASAGRFIEALERSGEADDTYMIVTGDHGEEFFECGFWGHTSSFSPEQVQVPFLFRGPGIEPGLESRPTSHLDVSNTLLELLGADPATRPGYSLGFDLLNPAEKRERVVAGWSDIGLWTDSGIFDLPLTAPGLGGWVQDIDCYNRQWEPLMDLAARCRAERAALEQMAIECVRFLDVPK